MALTQLDDISALYVGNSTHRLPNSSKRFRQVTTLRAALALIRTEKFELVIVERDLDDGDGIVLAPTIRRIHPYSISILVSKFRGWATIEAAQQLGFSMVVDDEISQNEFNSQVEGLLRARSFPPAEQGTIRSKIHLLSLREREILLDLATGATTEEIALKRFNSVATIKSHLTSIYRKLGVRNRVEAISQIQT
jgi:DNA-binding NarL/FixJ family response regulator